MNEFEKHQIISAFQRCYGLKELVASEFKGSISELARQSGMRADFIISNIEEIKNLKY